MLDKRSSVSRDKEHFIKLYTVFVRCHLEYSIQSWSPHLKQDIKVLETVQQRAIRMTSGLTGTYEEKLKQVGLTTLEDRRTRGDLIQTFKILHQCDNIPVSTFFKMAGSNHGHATRLAGPCDPQISGLNLAVPPVPNSDLRRFFFSQRVVNYWNALPNSVNYASSVNDFKNKLDAHSTTF